MTTDLAWFKSSYSGDDGGDCLEVALEWRKSSYSGDDGGQCVEVTTCPHTIHVRDSKAVTTGGPSLAFAAGEWSSFVAFATLTAVQ